MSVYRHPTALVESEDIGAGTKIWAFVHIMPGVKIGKGCHIGDHCFLEKGVVLQNNVTIKNGVSIWEGVRIEDDVFIGPNVVFTNDLWPRSPRSRWAGKKYHDKKWVTPTLIQKGASIGANSTLLAGITIGRYAAIGAGVVVTKDVPRHALFYGNPATIQGYVCRCGQKLVIKEGVTICLHCKAKYKATHGKLLV